MTLIRSLKTSLITRLTKKLIESPGVVAGHSGPPDTIEKNNQVFWLKTDAVGAIKESANNISKWSDIFASDPDNPNNAEQGLSTDMPLLVEGELNGKDVVRFDGSTKFFNFPTNIILGTTARTFFFVVRAVAHTPHEAIIALTSNNDTDGKYDLGGNNTTGRLTLRTSTGKRIWNEDIVDATNFHILTIQNAANSNVNVTLARINGVDLTQQSTTSGVINTKAGGVSTLGKSTVHDEFFQGDIAEAIGYSAELSSNNIDFIEQYLSDEWGPSLP